MKKQTTPCPEHPAIGSFVQFNEEHLLRRDENNGYRKRYENRVGKVTGYRMGATEPTVTFEKDGRRAPQKLFEVRIRYLDAVTFEP